MGLPVCKDQKSGRLLPLLLTVCTGQTKIIWQFFSAAACTVHANARKGVTCLRRSKKRAAAALANAARPALLEVISKGRKSAAEKP